MDHKKRWILVTADRGIPTSLIFFKKPKAALAAERRFRRRMNLDYEETSLFVVDLGEALSKDRLSVEL